jgi:hypothetical protein
MKKTIVLLLLCSCAPVDAALERMTSRLKQPNPQEIRQAIHQECINHGVPYGTAEYRQCYMHYENMVIQAALAGRGSQLPLVTAYTNTPNFQPKLECRTEEQFGQLKTVCY